MRLPWTTLQADAPQPAVLIVTPVKNAARELPHYLKRLRALTFPHTRLSVGLLESDSDDGTFELLERDAPRALRDMRSVGIWKHDFGYRLPPDTPRWATAEQPVRRATLARSRNHLLFRALTDQDWVLWLDVDVWEFPTDLIERLLATGRSIVQPHCVLRPGGPSFDTNAWRDQGAIHMDDLRGGDEFVELDAVGGTVLWIRADIHRDGLIFPPVPYGVGNPRTRGGTGEIETEGLGIMARDMGHIPWGMPNFEVRHRPY